MNKFISKAVISSYTVSLDPRHQYVLNSETSA